MALYGYGPVWLWPCMVMALYSYGPVWLWPVLQPFIAAFHSEADGGCPAIHERCTTNGHDPWASGKVHRCSPSLHVDLCISMTTAKTTAKY